MSHQAQGILVSPLHQLKDCLIDPPPASTIGHVYSSPLLSPQVGALRRRRVQFDQFRTAETLMCNLLRDWCKAILGSAHKRENHITATLKRVRCNCEAEDSTATIQLPHQNVLNKKTPLCPCTKPGYTKFTRQSDVGSSLQH